MTGRPVTYLKDPMDHVLFRVMKGCLKAVFTEKYGYDAQLAHINYRFAGIDDVAIRIDITGYSDKIFEFARIYLDTIKEYA